MRGERKICAVEFIRQESQNLVENYPGYVKINTKHTNFLNKCNKSRIGKSVF